MELILFTGLQGSGKSTFYHTHFADTHLRINLDMLRTRRRESAILTACLSCGQRLVIDNTNPTAKDRARYLHPARQARFRTVAYAFHTPFQVCHARNAARTGKKRVPDVGLKATASKRSDPAPDEGFDQIFSVDQNGVATLTWSRPDEVR